MKQIGKKLGEKKECKGCGKMFIVASRNQAYCTVECRERKRKKREVEMYKKRKMQKKLKEAEEKKKNKNKEVHLGELAAFNDKAKQMGLTYGQYMIFLQTEKDREERAKIS